MIKDTKKQYLPHKRNSDTTLDTLEVTSDFFLSKSHQNLYWSTLRKHSTIQSNMQLIDVAPKVWKDKYWKAYHCQDILLQDGNTLRGSLCRKRWCQNCNRIKTAEMIKGYSKPLQELQKEDDLYLITLTSKTVKGKRLRHEIERRYKAFTRIKDNLRRNHNIKLVGCRKLEVTYSKKHDWYHPHFHFIQKGKREAEMLLKYWYKHNPLAGHKGQDITLIDSNNTSNLVEVFKYATKQIADDETTAKALHNIFVAIDGKRVFQTYGKLRKVKEVKEAKEQIENADFIMFGYDIYRYDKDEIDYTNAYNSKLLNTQEIRNKLNHNNGNNRKRKKRISKDT
tara:strand:+ start:724 stop:1737 length:1014 start_codon:yes stop_codon:yes gene_type:complete